MIGGEGPPLPALHGGPGFPHNASPHSPSQAMSALSSSANRLGQSDRPDDFPVAHRRAVEEVDAQCRHLTSRINLLGHWAALAIDMLSKPAMEKLVLVSPLVSAALAGRRCHSQSRVAYGLRVTIDRCEARATMRA